MDTRWFGPSGWELFHLIAFRSPHPDDVLNQMKDVLPCKYCRASTTQYVHDHPLRGDPGKWLYEIHNMVNNKLRTQCADDPKVVATQRTFMHALAKVFPFDDYRAAFADYIEEHEVALSSQRAYLRWMYGLLKAMSERTRSDIPSYKAYVRRVAYYKSGCSSKNDRSSTCRKQRGGGRDHHRTHRVSHRELLGKTEV